MFEFLNLPSSDVWPFDVPLWDIIFKSTIAFALAAITCWLLRRRSAALRHCVWALAITASLLVPLTACLLPRFPLAILPASWGGLHPVVINEIGQSSSMRISAPTGSGSFGETAIQATSHQLESPSPASAREADLVSHQRLNGQSPRSATSVVVNQMLVLCWLIGTTFGSCVFVVSLVQQWLRLRHLQTIDEANWTNSVATAANAIGLSRVVPTLESDEICVPAAVGVFRPRLVVPRYWRTWNRAQRQCILLHELAHIKRWDVATQILGRVALLAYWFNPLAWYAARQLRVERELASDDCVLTAGQAASDYAEQLLRTLRSCRFPKVAMGLLMAHSARLDQRVLAVLDPQRRRDPVGSRLAIMLLCIVGAIGAMLGGLTLTTETASADSPTDPGSAAPMPTVEQMWKETYTIEYPGTLPVSLAFSANGEVLLTGDTNGEVMALVFDGEDATWRWKAQVGAGHAALAFSADGKQVYATYKDGVRILDAERGKETGKIDVPASSPTAIGVFPDKLIPGDVTYAQIVFGNSRGYFVKMWVPGRLDTLGTIETRTVADGKSPADESAAPLAVDPQGRSAIMTGPIDASGEVSGAKGKNVLWAYVCGDYSEGSPGNRVMVGHTATVVSAAWAKEGSTAVTGDAAGRVIVWDAKQMKETGRLELGGRVAALAMSDDGTHTAAYVLGKQGEVFVWETAKPVQQMKPIHTELGDFSGPALYADLSFSPDSRKLAGCAIDTKWLTRLGELMGKVRVWELAPEPHAQLPPKHVYSKTLPRGSLSNFVILDNHSILMPAAEEGAVDFRSIADGTIQARLVLGKFTIGGMKLSTDRRWLAMEQHALNPSDVLGSPSTEFDVGVWDLRAMKQQATISSCSRMLDVAAAGRAVAVVREKRIELWDVANSKLLKAAPFKHARIDTAAFSPDGRLLAISDQNDLVLWRWGENRHERIGLGRSVGSLAFSPDGKFLAEGPMPAKNIQIRDVETRKVVQTLDNPAQLSIDVPSMVYTQSGRVLIACDTFNKEIAVPHRIHLWNMADRSLAHQLTIPTGLPQTLDVSANGRYFVTILKANDGAQLSVWRLDGVTPVKEPGPLPPPATAPLR